MKRSSGPRKTAHLSEPAHHQLNMYALAAGAAGVGVLALTQPVEAKIVYTPAHRVIGPDSRYLLDLNHDGITDFTIANSYNCPDRVSLLLWRNRRTGLTGSKALFLRGVTLPGLTLSRLERSLAQSAHFLPVLWSSL
jgi:hypothetical protein